MRQEVDLQTLEGVSRRRGAPPVLRVGRGRDMEDLVIPGKEHPACNLGVVPFDPVAEAWGRPTQVIVPNEGVPILIAADGRVPIAVESGFAGSESPAMMVTMTNHEWKLDLFDNRRVWVHLWGQPPTAVATTIRIEWPLIGLRSISECDRSSYWVLLESECTAKPRGRHGSSDLDRFSRRASTRSVLTNSQLAGNPGGFSTIFALAAYEGAPIGSPVRGCPRARYHSECADSTTQTSSRSYFNVRIARPDSGQQP